LTRARAVAASLAVLLAASCAGTTPPPAAPKEAADGREDACARLLEAEDTRTFDPSLFAGAARSSGDSLSRFVRHTHTTAVQQKPAMMKSATLP